MDWLIDQFLRDAMGLERVADWLGWLVAAAFCLNLAQIGRAHV